jgi:transcriptional regulator with XRE-family HTH domain
MLVMALGRTIQKLMQQKGLGQKELAEKAGVSRQAIGVWLVDPSGISADNLIKIAKALDVSPGELLALMPGYPRKKMPDNQITIKQLEDIKVRIEELIAAINTNN